MPSGLIIIYDFMQLSSFLSDWIFILFCRFIIYIKFSHVIRLKLLKRGFIIFIFMGSNIFFHFHQIACFSMLFHAFASFCFNSIGLRDLYFPGIEFESSLLLFSIFNISLFMHSFLSRCELFSCQSFSECFTIFHCIAGLSQFSLFLCFIIFVASGSRLFITCHQYPSCFGLIFAMLFRISSCSIVFMIFIHVHLPHFP